MDTSALAWYSTSTPLPSEVSGLAAIVQDRQEEPGLFRKPASSWSCSRLEAFGISGKFGLAGCFRFYIYIYILGGQKMALVALASLENPPNDGFPNKKSNSK